MLGLNWPGQGGYVPKQNRLTKINSDRFQKEKGAITSQNWKDRASNREDGLFLE